MSEPNEEVHVDRFEKLKAETLDLLGGIGGTWMSFEDIASEHEACDGEVDRDQLLVALEELVEEGEIEHQLTLDGDEYRWRDRSLEEDMGAKVRRLEEEVEALKTRNEYVEGMLGAYERALAVEAAKLEKALKPGADTATSVREVAAHLRGLVTL